MMNMDAVFRRKRGRAHHETIYIFALCHARINLMLSASLACCFGHVCQGALKNNQYCTRFDQNGRVFRRKRAITHQAHHESYVYFRYTTRSTRLPLSASLAWCFSHACQRAFKINQYCAWYDEFVWCVSTQGAPDRETYKYFRCMARPTSLALSEWWNWWFIHSCQGASLKIKATSKNIDEDTWEDDTDLLVVIQTELNKIFK